MFHLCCFNTTVAAFFTEDGSRCKEVNVKQISKSGLKSPHGPNED